MQQGRQIASVCGKKSPNQGFGPAAEIQIENDLVICLDLRVGGAATSARQ
jgi:hypothetical protein